jgi:hypothetical protein
MTRISRISQDRIFVASVKSVVENPPQVLIANETVYLRSSASRYNPRPFIRRRPMKSAMRLQWLVGMSALAIAVICFGLSQWRASPRIVTHLGSSIANAEFVDRPPAEPITKLIFTTGACWGTAWIEEAECRVWYCGIGGELLASFHGGGEAFGGRSGYVLDGWSVWPDKRGRYPEERLIKSLRQGILLGDVDRILLGMPMNAPDREVLPKLLKKEFRKIDGSFNWAAYAARQNQCEFVPNARRATILAADHDPRDRAGRASQEAVDISQWH